MYLEICGDSNCPNKKCIEELEREVQRLKSSIWSAISRLSSRENDVVVSSVMEAMEQSVRKDY